MFVVKQLLNPINSDQPCGDGYLLLAGLCDQFWDGLYPLPDEDGQEQLAAAALRAVSA